VRKNYIEEEMDYKGQVIGSWISKAFCFKVEIILRASK